MADQPPTPSGSRWEPGSEDGAPEMPSPDTTNDQSAGPLPAAPLDGPAAVERRAQLRGRAILAGAATALTLGGGLTGFVIGHATAGDGDDVRPANFSRQGPDEGDQFGDGQRVPPGFDRDRNGGPPSSDGGSGSSRSGDPT